MEASSSSSAPTIRQRGGYSYEVFLSFRGEDTRKTFTDHLYTDLIDKGIHTFRDDDELSKGEAIKPELLNAINQSKVSVPILSKGYASSKWCLMELAQMVKCMEAGNHKILPIFYHVEPREVRHRKREYAEAFSVHQKEHPSTVVEEWTTALETVGKLKGWHLDDNGYEGSLRSEVVLEVLAELKKYQTIDITDNVVGIEDHVDEVMDLLDTNIPDVRIVGIWGMAGSGKTTIAKFIYNQLKHKFDYCSFLGDISEASKPRGIELLQAQLASDVLGRVSAYSFDVRTGKYVFKQRFYDKKVLIVLDDVDEAEQLNALVPHTDSIAAGSRIIITTRNRDVLKAEPKKVYLLYEVKEMDEEVALLLFCKHAFKQDFAVPEYDNLSREIVKAIGGIPLAIEVVASFLSNKLKDKAVWEEKLGRLKRDPNIQEKLRVVTDSLNHEEREIFLDIACLVCGMDRRIPVPMWKARELYPVGTVNGLLAKCLIKLTDGNTLWMHNLLRDLGREAVHTENRDEPGERSRLWRSEDGLQVLDDEDGTKKVQAICLAREPGLEQRHFSGEELRKLSHLLFLDLGYANLNGGFNRCLRRLKWFGWHGVGHTQLSIPSELHLKDLVVLDLSESSIGENWGGWNSIQEAEKLEVLNLRSCQQLRSTPHFSSFLPIKRLILEDCHELSVVHPSIGRLTALESLNMKKCWSLEILPDELGSLVGLTELFIDETPIRKLPEHMPNLETLSAKSCKVLSLTTLSLHRYVSLKELNLSHTLSVESVDGIRNLQLLDVSHSSVMHFTSATMDLQKLEVLNASGCGSLREVPAELGRLKSLRILRLDSTGVTSIPASIGGLCHLEVLDLGSSKCEETLPELPSSLVNVRVTCRSSMTVIPNLSDLINLTELEFLQCCTLALLPAGVKSLSKLRKLKLHSTNIVALPEEMSELFQLKELIISDCDKLEFLPELPSGLRRLLISRCSSLCRLPKLSNLEKLGTFCLLECGNIVEIPNLGDLKLLRTLRIRAPLVTIHGLEMLSSLVYLSLVECVVGNSIDLSKLKGVSNLEVAFCHMLQKLEGLDSLSGLKRLKIINCETLQELEGIQKLTLVEEIWIRQCPALKSSPNLLALQKLRVLKLALEISSCNPVKTLPNFSTMRNLRTLNLQILEHLMEIEGLVGLVSLETLVISRCTRIEMIPDLSMLQELKTLQLHGLTNLKEIQGLAKLLSLEILIVSGCNHIESLPSLSLLRKLKTLKLRGLEKVLNIRGLSGLVSLESFAISHCDAIVALPGLSMMQSLRELALYSCRQLEDVQGISELVTLESLVILKCEKINILRYIPMLWNLKTLEFELQGHNKQLWGDRVEIQQMNQLQSLETLAIYSLVSPYLTVRQYLRLARGFNFKRLELFLGESLSVDYIMQDLRRLKQDDPMVASEAELIVWPYKLNGLLQLLTQQEFTALELQDPELSVESIHRLIAEKANLEQLIICHPGAHPSVQELEVKKLLKLLVLKKSEFSWSITILETPLLQMLKAIELNYCDHLVDCGGFSEIESSLSIVRSDALPNLSRLQKLKRVMVYSCEQLKDIQVFPELESLEELHIELCHALEALPDLYRLQKLKRMVLCSCSRLKNIQGLRESEWLEMLKIENCNSLEALPNLSKLQKLKVLVLSNCSQLKDIQGLSELEWLEELNIEHFGALEAIPYLPRKLSRLVIFFCRKLKDIGVGELDCLEKLKIEQCRALEALPNFCRQQRLKILVLRSCGRLKDIQGLSELECLEELNIQQCYSIEALPNLSRQQRLKSLVLRTCGQLKHIQGLSQLESLEELDIEQCDSIEALPKLSRRQRLKRLVLRSCGQLKVTQGLDELEWLEVLSIENCYRLEALPYLSRLQNLKILVLRYFGQPKDDIQGLCELECLEGLHLEKLYPLEVLPNLSRSQRLKRLVLHSCFQLKDIQGLCELECLEELTIRHCNELEALPNLARLQRLKKVQLRGCKQLKDIKGLLILKNLELDISECPYLKEVPVRSSGT